MTLVGKEVQNGRVISAEQAVRRLRNELCDDLDKAERSPSQYCGKIACRSKLDRLRGMVEILAVLSGNAGPWSGQSRSLPTTVRDYAREEYAIDFERLEQEIMKSR